MEEEADYMEGKGELAEEESFKLDMNLLFSKGLYFLSRIWPQSVWNLG